MMSGPAPVLAATAAFGRTSSQLSLSTRTSMPYLAVKACTFLMYWSMSPWTKRLQRSTRSFAPFSGWLFHWACASFTQIIGSVALAHHRRDVDAGELAEDLRVRAGGLDHHHFRGHAVVGYREMLGPHADHHFAALGDCGAHRDGQVHAAADRDSEPGAVSRQAAGEKIHRRRSDEARDKLVRRFVVELQGRADLLDAARIHDHDLVRHGHRLDLVVSHVDRRRLQSLVQRLDLGAHRYPELRVEVGKRLIEQEHLGLPYDRAPHRDALALATRELAGVAPQVLHQPEDHRRLLDPHARLLARFAGELQAEGHVVVHAHVRVERVVLEHHRDVPLLRRDAVDDALADRDPAA